MRAAMGERSRRRANIRLALILGAVALAMLIWTVYQHLP